MGNYIAYADLEYRMGNTRIVSLSTGRDDAETYVGTVIDRAEGLINGYAGKLYAPPLPASDLIQEWTMRIAEYEMYKNGQGGDVPLKYKSSYDEVMTYLKDVASGLLIPPNTDDEVLARKSTSGDSFDMTSDDPLMTDDKIYPNSDSDSINFDYCY